MTTRPLQVLLFTLVLCLPAQARSQTDYAAPVVTRLEAEGFTVSEIKRTLLGRILIVSRNRNSLREVVLNRHTGEVLRDRRFGLSASTQAPQSPITKAPAPDQPSGANAGGNGGKGGNGGGGNGNGNN